MCIPINTVDSFILNKYLHCEINIETQTINVINFIIKQIMTNPSGDWDTI